MIGYLLFLIGRTAAILGMPFGILYTVIRRIKRWNTLGPYFLDMGYVYDVLINVCYGDFFNDVLRKKGGYDYGNPNDSISRATGMNEALNKLKYLGEKLKNFLNRLDKDHTKKAASK